MEDLKKSWSFNSYTVFCFRAVFLIYVLVVNALSIPFIVQWREKKKKERQIGISNSQSNDSTLKNEICENLTGGKVWFGIILWVIREQTLLPDNRGFVEKYETIIKEKKRRRKTSALSMLMQIK